MPERKVCVVVASRANYGSIKSAMRAIEYHQDLKLQLIVGASSLLPRFGAVIDVIKQEGFKPAAEVYMIVEGENPITMAKSTGLGLIELATSFQNLKPDIVLVVGDRFEQIATAIAASYMNIPLAQTMGGEVSGTIDGNVRHAITKLAHIHFPANEKSAERIIKMGEEPGRVYVVGCPRIDIVMEVLGGNPKLDIDVFEKFKGVGGSFSLEQPYLLVVQHPVTTEYDNARSQIEETLFVLKELQIPTIMLWPNIDAGSDMISKGIRTFREHQDVDHFLHLFTNLSPEIYTKLMFNCACMVGNSSSPIREGAIIGVPAVNIGSRQSGREQGRNVINVGYERKEIMDAIVRQVNHGKYPADNIYGDGKAGERIADILAACDLSVQKQITY